MRGMLALTPSATPPHAELRDVPDPTPQRGEALVAVQAISLNRGEVRHLATATPGALHGWDLAGVVRRAAADGSGPPEGARVVGLLRPGAWAQLAAVPTTMLAEIPDGVSVQAAACLPVAGLTALSALDVCGLVLGRRVLVTGASGGVGRFAVQLAARAGAHVTGVSASPERARGLRDLGADEVIHELEGEGPRFDAIVEGVGGASLSAAMRRIAPGGTIVTFAPTDPSDVTFPSTWYGTNPGAKLYAFRVFEELVAAGGATRGLERLLRLLAAGRIDPQIDSERSWREAGAAIEALNARRIAGKAVLLVD
jgi:NADPH:quinone reductase-like Zn-dependent oxidoreductase